MMGQHKHKKLRLGIMQTADECRATAPPRPIKISKRECMRDMHRRLNERLFGFDEVEYVSSDQIEAIKRIKEDKCHGRENED